MGGNSDGEVLEEATAEYLQQMVENGEIVRERHLKRQAFIAEHQSGVIAFIPRVVYQVSACDDIVNSINSKKAAQ